MAKTVKPLIRANIAPGLQGKPGVKAKAGVKAEAGVKAKPGAKAKPGTKAKAGAKAKPGLKSKADVKAKAIAKGTAQQLTKPDADMSVAVLDRLYAVIVDRRSADPAHSHSARLLARGPAKVAQKFGEEAVECLIECAAGNTKALIAESADVLYHLLVMWVATAVDPADVWAELTRREGVSGVVEKASRGRTQAAGTRKIP